MGCALLDSEQNEEALGYFETAIKLNEQNYSAHNNKGVALLELKRPEEALAVIEKALKKNPNSSTYLNNKGSYYHQMGNNTEALKYSDLAIQEDPCNDAAYSNKGASLSELGRHEEAIECIAKALRLDPKQQLSIQNMAYTLMAMGKTDEAIKYLGIEEKLIEEEAKLNPGSLNAQKKLETCQSRIAKLVNKEENKDKDGNQTALQKAQGALDGLLDHEDLESLTSQSINQDPDLANHASLNDPEKTEQENDSDLPKPETSDKNPSAPDLENRSNSNDITR
jgi:tetratricopeptide (TPR) repeat protein